jgi:hypothetical protein
MAATLGLLCADYGYADYALYTTDDTLPGAEHTAWVTNWLFMVPVFIAPCFQFLLFPDGRPASPRSRSWPLPLGPDGSRRTRPWETLSASEGPSARPPA